MALTKVKNSVTSFTQDGTGAVERGMEDKLREVVSVKDFGAQYDGSDESTAAQAALTQTGVLYVPRNKTLVCKNITVSSNDVIKVDGTIKLPASCSDGDILLYGDTLTNVDIQVNDLDGNESNQSGTIGTHLIYLTNISNSSINVRYVHDHYIIKGAYYTDTKGDGLKDASTGAIWLHTADSVKINVDLLATWGREGIQIRNGTDCEVSLGHAKGRGLGQEYSSVQVEGVGNKIVRASCDGAGASAVGFDTTDGSCSNILATNTVANNGLNIGHPGFPSSRSVISNVVIDSCYLSGIGVASSTEDLIISNFSIQNAGTYGVSVSDSSQRVQLSNGIIKNSGLSNLNVVGSGAEIDLNNTEYSNLDELMITLSSFSASFTDGEVINGTGASAGASGTLRKMIYGDGTAKAFVNSITGTFTTGGISGATSGETAVISATNIPSLKNESSDGVVLENIYTTTATEKITKLKDGTLMVEGTASITTVTPGVLASTVVNLPLAATFTAEPNVTATVRLAASTNSFAITRLTGKGSAFSAPSTAATVTIELNTDTAQTYSVNYKATGRWK